MIWEEYIAFADRLAEHGLAVMDRTAISRAYYGSFNLARRWLEANGTPIDNHRAHKQVWAIFRAAELASDHTRDDWILVGNLGSSMRGLRNRADYDDWFPGLAACTVGALQDAKRIFALLPKLELAD